MTDDQNRTEPTEPVPNGPADSSAEPHPAGSGHSVEPYYIAPELVEQINAAWNSMPNAGAQQQAPGATGAPAAHVPPSVGGANPASAPYSTSGANPASAPYGASGANPASAPYSIGDAAASVPPGPPPSPYGAYYTGPAPVPQKPKRKVWPWVLGIALLVILLTFGGCVGCAFVSVVAFSDDSSDSYASDTYAYDFDYDYELDNPDAYDDLFAGSTIDEIEGIYGLTTQTPGSDGRCTAGIYVVDAAGDLQPGLYYFGGSQTAESAVYLYEPTDDGTYLIDTGITYFGNYYMELDQGDLIVFAPGVDDLAFSPADEAPVACTAPYPSGLYRVGIDIPAGSYTIRVQEEAAATTSNECAAYVMTDLEFDDDSIVDTKYVAVGGSQKVTVTDGQWLELFAVTAEPIQ